MKLEDFLSFMRGARHHKAILRSQRGSAILQVLMIGVLVAIIIGSSIIYIQSRAQVVGLTNKRIDHRIVLDGLFAYTVNGIKQSWCYSSSWAQDISCNLNHTGNIMRLLISNESLAFLETSATPHPKPTASTKLTTIEKTVDLGTLPPSHPVYKITLPLLNIYEKAKFTIQRADNGISTTKGNEVPLRVKIELTPSAKYVGQLQTLELESKVIVYARELSYFGLILANDLHLGVSAAPNPDGGNSGLGRASVGKGKGLRFESPVFVNGNLHLPSSGGSVPMNNVVFVEKIVFGEGMPFQDGKLFFPKDAGGPGNQLNQDLKSFSGLLGGFELDVARDRGLDYLFQIAPAEGSFTNFDLCRARLNAASDLTLTKDSQLYVKARSTSVNEAGISASLGTVDNFIEQNISPTEAYSFKTNIPGVPSSGVVHRWTGGVTMKAKLYYEGLQPSPAALRGIYFNEFYLPRDGEISVYPLGPGGGKPEIRIVTSPLIINGSYQHNQIDASIRILNSAALDIASFKTGNVFMGGSLRLSLEAMDYGYNFGDNLRDSNSSHPVMGPFKLNGVIFKKVGSAFELEYQNLNEWFTNPKLQADVNYPVYDKNQAPIEQDFASFDSQCFKAPDENAPFYASFESASWATSYAKQARHAWSFTPDTEAGFVNGYFSGTKVFTSADAGLGGGNYPEFKIQSLIKRCEIDQSANFVTGFYVCEELVINARTEPLRIIGTFIVKNLIVHNSAYLAGIRWSTIYHPQSVYELRDARVLGRMKNGTTIDCDSSAIPPLWVPNIGTVSAVNQYLCNPASLRTADPFKWTTVDPDCGVDEGATQVKCKRLTNRFLVKEISRTKGL